MCLALSSTYIARKKAVKKRMAQLSEISSGGLWIWRDGRHGIEPHCYQSELEVAPRFQKRDEKLKNWEAAHFIESVDCFLTFQFWDTVFAPWEVVCTCK